MAVFPILTVWLPTYNPKIPTLPTFLRIVKSSGFKDLYKHNKLSNLIKQQKCPNLCWINNITPELESRM
jgi:hypothetical protein